MSRLEELKIGRSASSRTCGGPMLGVRNSRDWEFSGVETAVSVPLTTLSVKNKVDGLKYSCKVCIRGGDERCGASALKTGKNGVTTQ